MNTTSENFLTDEQIAQYKRDGYIVLRGLLSRDEVAAWREHFMKMHEAALDPSWSLREYYAPKTMEEAEGDILKHFPRIMHPHRFDEKSMNLMLDVRFEKALRELFGDEPLAAQSMLYFKPPGARGQALHQDDFYLRTSPGQCLAAWLALDDADSQNGTLFVVPGSHAAGVLCPHAADLSKSFTTEEVDVPEGMKPIEVPLEAGDVMFFCGSVIHGSYPNATTDRFRRAFICHYVPNVMTQMSQGYYPLHTFAGEKLERDPALGGGPCGNEDWEAYRRGVEEQVRLHGGEGGERLTLTWLDIASREREIDAKNSDPLTALQ